MVKYCFTPAIAHQTVVFIGNFLQEASKASAVHLAELVLETKEFVSSLPYSFVECLGKCDEIRTLGYNYDIDGSTDPKALATKVSEYVALHYLNVHRWAVDLD